MHNDEKATEHKHCTGTRFTLPLPTNQTMIITSGGREFDVDTTNGANDYLQSTATTTWDGQQVTAVSSQVFLGLQVYNATFARNEMTRMEQFFQPNLPSTTIQQMRTNFIDLCIQPYSLIQALAKHAHPQIFAAIPVTEHVKLVQHGCDVFGNLSTCPKWTATGVLQKHDKSLLVAIMNCYQHVKFFQAAVDGKLMDKLAAFAKSCGGDDDARQQQQQQQHRVMMPCPDIAQYLRIIVLNYRSMLVQQWDTPNKEIYQQLEECGMLGQYFRIVTVPILVVDATRPDPFHSSDNFGMCMILDEIYNCTLLVKNKLKKSTPTGQILHAVISGEDGWRGTGGSNNSRQEVISELLLRLQKKADRVCYHCDQNGLHYCSKCQDALYCSAECQRADWKKHKRSCKKPQSTT